MDAATTFHLLVNGGFALGIEGDTLTVRPTSRLTDTLRRAIRTNKPELLELLRKSQSPNATADAFERALIYAAEQGKTLRLADGKLEMIDRPSWRWLVTHPDGTVTDHTVTPPDTLAQMQRAYPGAVGFEPLYHRTGALEAAA